MFLKYLIRLKYHALILYVYHVHIYTKNKADSLPEVGGGREGEQEEAIRIQSTGVFTRVKANAGGSNQTTCTLSCLQICLYATLLCNLLFDLVPFM